MANTLEMKNIVKIYPNAVMANNNVSLQVKRGEIHALVGENGAGKSTLMKILFGIEKPTSGKILLDGKEIKVNNPLEAINWGFGMVHQHFMLVQSMSVAENIVLGSEPGKGIKLDRNEMVKKAKEIIEKYAFDINPNEKIYDLPIGTRQKVEILKALYKGAEILILDEPTAVLTPQETQELFIQLKKLKEQGHTIIFISHKLNEIKEICNRVTIMRNAQSVGVYDVDKISQEDISNLMVGKIVNLKIEKTQALKGDVVLDVNDVSLLNELQRYSLRNVSFKLHKGIILGIVGVEGNGQRELIEVITGLKKIDAGEIKINNQIINKKNVEQIRNLGLSHIPEDRMEVGSSLTSSVLENLISIFTKSKRFSKNSFLKLNEVRKFSKELIENYNIKVATEDVEVKMLSGGNIQKVIVAREFSSNADCIIANQPTRGIDIGSAKFIHRKLVQMRDKGAAILLNSADLAEVMSLSDSLLVMYEGRFVAYFEDACLVNEEQLGRFMLGLETQDEDLIRRVSL